MYLLSDKRYIAIENDLASPTIDKTLILQSQPFVIMSLAL